MFVDIEIISNQIVRTQEEFDVHHKIHPPVASAAPIKDGYLIDFDGTLVSGQRAMPGAQWLLSALQERFVIVSNDAEHTPAQLSRGLLRLGMRVKPDKIVLAGTTAIDRLAAQRPRARVMMLASVALKRYALRCGLRLADEDCEVVYLGRDRKFNYAKLAAAARATASGAKLIIACPDGSHRGPNGEPVPETGALAAAILASVGDVEHEVIGKPEPHLFRAGCRRLNLPPERIAVIGDNPATDGAGAKRLGMAFVHVEPGDLGPGMFALET